MLNSPGTILQQTRCKLGYTIADIHSATKIKKEYIEGLENDNVSVFPAELYYKNFLKSYALFLKLDFNELIQMYEQNKKERQKNFLGQNNDREQKFVCFYKNNGKVLVYIGFCIVIICLIIVIKTMSGKTIQKQKISTTNNIIIFNSSSEVVSEQKQQTEQIKQKLNVKTNMGDVPNKKTQGQSKDKNSNVIYYTSLPKVVSYQAEKVKRQTEEQIKQKLNVKTNTGDVINKNIQEQSIDRNSIVISTLTETKQQTEEQIKQKLNVKTNTGDVINKNIQEQSIDRNSIVISTLTETKQQTEEQIKQKLYIKVFADTWIKITADDKDVFEGMVAKSIESETNDEFVVKIGNIDTVEVYFNGKLIDIAAGKVPKSRVKTITLKRNQN